MRYWWVNQNQTYDHEVGGGYLWSPKVNSNGARNHFYDNMTEAQPGDVVFSFCDTFIKAVGVVQARAESLPKPPEFGNAGAYWGTEGWYVRVAFTELAKPIRPKDYMHVLGPTLPGKYSPLQENGNGNQGVYLAEVPEPMAVTLTSLLEGQVEKIINATGVAEDFESQDEEAEKALRSRGDIPETEKQQLVKARRGQGLFRSRVELIEKACRITGVSEKSHLRASHIKPWRDSTDAEKLDGNNGLLLSPHVDHLFDRGYITFDDDGSLIVSPHLSGAVLGAWNIPATVNVGPFNDAQHKYLAVHRGAIFKK